MPQRCTIEQIEGSSDKTASAKGTGIAEVIGADRAVVLVAVTAGSGTVDHFQVYLEGSNDQVTWYELPATRTLKSTGTNAPATVGTNKRNFVEETSVTTSGLYVGYYEGLPAYVRPAWIIDGTGPHETFEIHIYGK